MGGTGVYISRDPTTVEVRVPINQGTPGTTTILSAVLARRHGIDQAMLTLSADATIKFAGSVSGDLTGPMDVAAKGGFVLPEGLTGIIKTALNEDLLLITTGGSARGIIKVITEA